VNYTSNWLNKGLVGGASGEKDLMLRGGGGTNGGDSFFHDEERDWEVETVKIYLFNSLFYLIIYFMLI
jgi:hypothetical protein